MEGVRGSEVLLLKDSHSHCVFHLWKYLTLSCMYGCLKSANCLDNEQLSDLGSDLGSSSSGY